MWRSNIVHAILLLIGMAALGNIQGVSCSCKIASSCCVGGTGVSCYISNPPSSPAKYIEPDQSFQIPLLQFQSNIVSAINFILQSLLVPPSKQARCTTEARFEALDYKSMYDFSFDLRPEAATRTSKSATNLKKMPETLSNTAHASIPYH